MAATPWHTYLVLTKRDPRPFFDRVIASAMATPYANTSSPEGYVVMDAATQQTTTPLGGPAPWPLPNVHLGVSAEDQETWDERVPMLLQCPAAVRWVSAEPLLGPLDLGPFVRHLDWVVAGGESGARARACDVQWLRSIRDQCADAHVPMFVKQLGARIRWGAFGGDGGTAAASRSAGGIGDRKGGEINEWPMDLRVRQVPSPEGRPQPIDTTPPTQRTTSA